MLLSLLPANKKRSSFEDLEACFKEFQSTMGMIGFINIDKIPSDTTLSKATLDKIYGDSRDAIEQALTEVGNANNEAALHVLNLAAGERRRTALVTGLSSNDGSIVIGRSIGRLFVSSDIPISQLEAVRPGTTAELHKTG
ncbi:unnamed protein product [Rhizoctonia solani]|uniref:Uncharacterized protein n=1 Tax=Rhizoctonia solani TaxID=456999 RepID=A0A8H3H6N7_9AGAM|nr:unnamed protein product [Rhizoctonia solani]CAE6501091.1 unnamed protein product [Rhizoctonia solani]